MLIAIDHEEHREVAERLRKDVGESSCIDYAVFRIAHEVLGIEHVTGAKAAHMLADLIDPTCHNKQIAYNKSAPKEFRTDNFICSECGETFCADGDGVNHPIDWAYCPNCGARVVDE